MHALIISHWATLYKDLGPFLTYFAFVCGATLLNRDNDVKCKLKIAKPIVIVTPEFSSL